MLHHHFIGIGGVGMSAIAQVLFERGVPVSGSDQAESPTLQRLRAMGLPVAVGHAPEHLANAQVVVISTAVGETNPELAEARRRGLVVRHRSEILAELMAAHRSIAVTGTHGKTTTTGMIATMLLETQLDPTVLVGGMLPAIGGTARTGKSPFLVAEADESDKSILRLTAEVAVLTNLEADHLDHYRDLEDIYEVMSRFLAGLPAEAAVIACLDDPGVRAVLPRLARPVITYGWHPEAQYRLHGEELHGTGSRFMLGDEAFELAVPGRHNVANAAAALAVGYYLGLDAAAMREGLARFGGVGRRFQIHGTAMGVTVVDDYAHHPAEIRATMATAKLMQRPIWAVFQPHRYTRTAALFDDFAGAFGEAFGVGVMDIYSAGEPANGVTSAQLAERLRQAHGDRPIHHWEGHAQAEEALASLLREGDVVLLMGAGNVNRLAEPLLARLRAREAASAASPA